MMKRTKWVRLAALLGSLSLGLAGCVGDSSVESTQGAKIELIDPVTEEERYEIAEKRTLYDVNAYVATVVPYVEEYSAEASFAFGSYGAFPGEKVKKGTEVIAADTKSIDEQIKNKQEYIKQMEEDYQKYVEKQQKAIAEYREKEAAGKWGVDKYEAAREPETIPAEDGSGTMVPNPKYEEWKVWFLKFDGDYRINKHAADILELEMAQKKELYELDLKHQKYELQSMQKNRGKATIKSKIDGELVAVRSFNPGDNVRAEVPVVAIGDLSQKLIKCEYINNRVIRNAQDVYAMVNGKRYEVEYQAISSDEYATLTASGEKVYSTFKIVDADDNVKIGGYAVITVVLKRLEDVVTVPKAAVSRDDSGNYVYVMKDGEATYVNVQIGYSDGVYTEITHGLEAGDAIVYSSGSRFGDSTVTLAKGEFHSDFSERAQLEYGASTYLTNDVENGTMYFKEMKVEKFQHVEKGDVIATVRVEADNLALKRNETKLTRLQTRLEDYKRINSENANEEYYKEAVQNYEDQIKDTQEAIAKQKSDFNVKVIRANVSGTIVELKDYKAEDVVQKGDRVARIADENTCYVIVEDQNQLLQYGNEVSVAYFDEQRQEHSVSGTVVTLSKMGVGQTLQSETAIVRVDKDHIREVLTVALAGEWWNRYRFTINAKLRNIDSVLLVPKQAVYEVGGKTYVCIKDKDGKFKEQSFVAGGSNDAYYWVVEGLTEGMEVCLR
ncbi:MAG: HlyD family efflux transporter periplasmic adaptor subunit [Lachnospiraceae bacterium]|nr:HlyD family efflux transporter periplasmic adaptor subunit [Lachnospiraceae bacterium]